MNKKGNKKKIEKYEEIIVDSIKEAAEEKSFYQLPINEILKIIRKRQIKDIDLIYKISSMTNENKGSESILLLNAVDIEEISLEECIKIISSFTSSPICRKTGELFEESMKDPAFDYEYEINSLKKENEELKNKVEEPKNAKNDLPQSYESDIFKAVNDGDLHSVRYLCESCHVDINEKDKYECDPLMIASINGKLEVVKYLCKERKANVETKDMEGYTPLYWAAKNSHEKVVEYLCDECNAEITDAIKMQINDLQSTEIQEYLISKLCID